MGGVWDGGGLEKGPAVRGGGGASETPEQEVCRGDAIGKD